MSRKHLVKSYLQWVKHFFPGPPTFVRPIKLCKEMQSLTSIIQQSLLPQLTTILRKPSQGWLRKHLPKKAGVCGLHIACGSGEDTFLIASLLNQTYCLHGIDENKVLIEDAKHAKEVGEWDQVNFLNTCPSTWKPEMKYDFVYSRIWKTDLLKQTGFLKNTRNNLKEDGKFILELIQFSGFSAFPYHPAFSRSAELILKTEQCLTNTLGLTEKYTDLLQSHGLRILEINYSPPAFIEKKDKKILSQILATFEEKLLQLGLVTKEELDSLLYQLKRYETRGDSLISRPGVYQILASR